MPSLVPPVVAGLPAEQPVLRAGALMLRPWLAADAPALLEVYADPAVQRWNCESLDADEAARYASEWADLWRSGSRAGWAVVRGTALVGRVTLSNLMLDLGQAEVTYWTAPQARGTGVAPQAVQAVATWAFDLGLNRLELQHSTQNGPSCRVAERAGFALEGTKRRAVPHQDGWHDMHLHARLA
jgi:ribosomal-protein-alanine N-acetyltransferase